MQTNIIDKQIMSEELENGVIKELFPISKNEEEERIEGEDAREPSDGEVEEDIDGDFDQDTNISVDETDDDETIGDDGEGGNEIGEERLSDDDTEDYMNKKTNVVSDRNVFQNEEKAENSDENSYSSDEDESDNDEPYEVKIHDNQKLDYIRENHIQEITEDFDEILILSNVYIVIVFKK